MILRWFLYFIPALLVELTAWVITPLFCLFVVKRQHTDIVKRTYNKATVTLEREFLPKWLSLFGTPDNAVDEYWWGLYTPESWFPYIRNLTQEQYDKSWFARYACRCLWLFRNTAYGWHYLLFSRPEDAVLYVKEHGIEGKGFWWEYIQRKSSWKLEYHLPIPFTRRYIHGNIGWKGHRGDDLELVMYANRVIGLRRYK